MKEDVLMEYVKDRKKHKVGMLIGQMGEDGKVKIGWSRCHKDDNFTREEGLANAAVNLGFAIPHSFAAAAKAFRVSCFLRFNAPVVVPMVMTNGLQERQSKPGSQRNSGHRMGCACYGKDHVFLNCTCRELALKARNEYGDNESVQALGRVARG